MNNELEEFLCISAVRDGNLSYLVNYLTTNNGDVSQEILDAAIMYGKETGNFECYDYIATACDISFLTINLNELKI
jgi:hypothetical protein